MLASFITGGKFGILVRCAGTLSESISKKSLVITLMLSIDAIYQEGYPQCKFQAYTLLCETCK